MFYTRNSIPLEKIAAMAEILLGTQGLIESAAEKVGVEGMAIDTLEELIMGENVERCLGCNYFVESWELQGKRIGICQDCQKIYE